MTNIRPANVLFLDLDASGEIVALVTKALNETVNARYCQSDQLTLGVLADTNPDCVLFALFGPRMDAFQMIGLLGELGFNGALMVIGPALEHADLVEAELRALGPGQRLSLINPTPRQPE